MNFDVYLTHLAIVQFFPNQHFTITLALDLGNLAKCTLTNGANHLEIVQRHERGAVMTRHGMMSFEGSKKLAPNGLIGSDGGHERYAMHGPDAIPGPATSL